MMSGSSGNITLIGMPASGKSSIGVVLAKALGYDFIDGDLLIQKRAGMRLSEIMKTQGNEALLQLEEAVHCALSCTRCVIAPGGSIVYSGRAMRHLKEIGTVVYLKLDYEDLRGRLQDAASRGVVLREGQTLEQLYQERVPLYEHWADITVCEKGRDLSAMVSAIQRELN